MRLSTKCIVFFACWASALATPAKIDDGDLGAAKAGTVLGGSGRDEKLLFTFITIAPEKCSTTGGKSGICYSSADCTTLKGTADGNCAKGLGVCCQITRTCGNTSAFQETTFVNPSSPSTQAAALGSCSLRITPLNSNICQLRLDFEYFVLAQPDPEGACSEDFLQVTGGSSSIPKICGENTGQHLYVDVSPQFGSALVNIDTSSTGEKWRIKVTQIECNSADRAPAGCLQFFNTTQGMISSFNFGPSASPPIVNRQLSSQVYGVCIKSQPGYCSITYTQTDGSQFSLSGDPGAVAPGLAGFPIVGYNADPLLGCPNDYLLIPAGMPQGVAGVISADRYCGAAFPSVTSSVQPFNLFLVTNTVESTDVDNFNQGFKLNYRMNPC